MATIIVLYHVGPPRDQPWGGWWRVEGGGEGWGLPSQGTKCAPVIRFTSACGIEYRAGAFNALKLLTTGIMIINIMFARVF